MIYSKSCEYAIRALVFLAKKPHGEYSTIQEISQHQAIPMHFLGKLLQQLAKFGLVFSQKGRSGGFTLALPADQVPLIKIVEYVDGLGYLNRCVIGLGDCGTDIPCPIHDTWAPIKESVMGFLHNVTVGALAEGLEEVPTGRA